MLDFIIAREAFIERLKEVTMDYEIEPLLKEFNRLSKEKKKIETLEDERIFDYIPDMVVPKLLTTYGTYVEKYIKKTPYLALRGYQMLDLLLFDILSPYELEHESFFEYSKIRHTLVAYFQPYALITLEKKFPTEFPEYVLKIKHQPEMLEKMAALYECLDELIMNHKIKKELDYLKILFEDEPYKLKLKEIEMIVNRFKPSKKILPNDIRNEIHYLILGF